MRKILTILLPLLLSGCLDIFFAPPMNLGGGGWEEMGVIGADIPSGDIGELVLAFGNDGTGCCVITANEHNNIIFRYPSDSNWSSTYTPIPTNARSLSLLFNDDNVPYLAYFIETFAYVASLSDNTRNDLTNHSGAAGGEISLALDNEGRLLYAYNMGTTLYMNRETTPGSFTNIFLTSGTSPFTHLRLMGRNNGDLLLCFTTNNFNTVLLRTMSNGQVPSYLIDEDILFPAQGALYHAGQDIVYTASASAAQLAFRQIPASASNGNLWADTPPQTVGNFDYYVRMAQHCGTHTMYLGYGNKDPMGVVILKHDGSQWRHLVGPFPDTAVGNFVLAVNPADNCLWMVAAVSDDDGAFWYLNSWRYVE